MKTWMVCVVSAACLSVADLCSAQPVALPDHDIAVLNFSGYETVRHADENTALGIGDVFDGLVRIESIGNIHGTVDLSPQLSLKEVTGIFQFHISAASSSDHLEFAPDFFRFFVGTGTTRNFDPASTDAVVRASDGSPWLEVSPGSFFESVNDPFNGAPRNRAWVDITRNFTGYDFAPTTFPSSLGQDPTHLYNGMVHGDHLVQAYFEDFPAPSDLANYSFKIRGQIYVQPLPEPSSMVLMISGLVTLIWYVLRR